jgi:F0F1-type ATP synthase assembly protein I
MAYFALFSEIGIVLLVTVLFGTLGGYWIDQRLGTIPIFAMVGFALGTIVGAIGCWRVIARALTELDDEDKR